MIFRLAFFVILVVAALLALYFFTRKKWDWNAYASSIAIAFSAILLIPVGMFSWVTYDNRLQVISTFDGIQLGSETADVKFIKGEPVFKLARPDNRNHWRYQDKLNQGNINDVIFKNGKVIELSFTGPCEYCDNINGFGIGSHYEEITKRFGESSDVHISDNELERRMNYPEWQVFFVLEKGQVTRHGIYTPNL